MSYHEGSNWQAKKEDEKNPIYDAEKMRQVHPDEWALRDIDLILDITDFDERQKIKMIAERLQKYFKGVKPERIFTLQDMMDCWDASEDHYAYSEYNRILESPNKEKYFKEKFNIDINQQ